jgi:hypothetical protein
MAIFLLNKFVTKCKGINKKSSYGHFLLDGYGIIVKGNVSKKSGQRYCPFGLIFIGG